VWLLKPELSSFQPFQVRISRIAQPDLVNIEEKTGALMATEVTLDELADVIDRGGFVLDVREDHEWQEGHVPNAHHIPMNEVGDNLDKLDDGARIFIICRSGGRSMTVANYLEAQGYDVVSVAGGTDGWASSGRDLSFEDSL